jgi:hypothetical protein
MTNYHAIAKTMNLADVRAFAHARGIYVSKRGRVDTLLLSLYSNAVASGSVQDYMSTDAAAEAVTIINSKRPTSAIAA